MSETQKKHFVPAGPAQESAFHEVVGSNPKLELLLEDDQAVFHEAGIFIDSTNELYFTSNRLSDRFFQKRIEIAKVALDSGPLRREVIPADIPMSNEGVDYKNGSVLFCGQGNFFQPSGIYEMSLSPPYKSKLLIRDFYGRPFNSPNDVAVASDGSIWFTDPTYGFEQGFRPSPKVPDQVYRYDPTTGSIRVMADGFVKPNGICFSPDEKIVYVTDTGRVSGYGKIDDTKPSTIYAFDVSTSDEGLFLTNRRLFAMASNGIPDGIKCDTEGNVFSGCGDGINIWSPGGVFLGWILVEGGVSNFCFGHKKELFILNETRLWRAQLG